MSDLFHEEVPDEYIEKVCRVMLAAKLAYLSDSHERRADRMMELLQSKLHDAAAASHIWWGVSVEKSEATVLPRIEKAEEVKTSGCVFFPSNHCWKTWGKMDLRGIHWVIVGGERRTRCEGQLRLPWVRTVHAECQNHHIPLLFLKQWGGVRKSENRSRNSTVGHMMSFLRLSETRWASLDERNGVFSRALLRGLIIVMPRDFHDKPYDPGTLTKLPHFRALRPGMDPGLRFS